MKAGKSVEVSQKKFNEHGREDWLKIKKQKGQDPELCLYMHHWVPISLKSGPLSIFIQWVNEIIITLSLGQNIELKGSEIAGWPCPMRRITWSIWFKIIIWNHSSHYSHIYNKMSDEGKQMREKNTIHGGHIMCCLFSISLI